MQNLFNLHRRLNYWQREKEKIDRQIIELQEKLDAKQALELEMEQLRGALQVMKHMDGDEDIEVQMKIIKIQKDLKEKEEEYQDMEQLHQALVVNHRKVNDEVQDGRKEVISVSIVLIKNDSKILCH